MTDTMYLVTGAAGFLGGEVVRELVARGDKVRAFVLPNDKSVQYIPKECEIAKGDLTDKASLEEFFTVPEGTQTIVLHIASIVTVNPEYNPKVMEVNVGGTKNIIDLCLKHEEVKKLVYCSSTGAIPELPKGTKITEVDHFDTTTLRDCYSQSKALASQAVLDAVHEHGLNACIVHPSGILGPGDAAVGATTSTLIKIINGGMPAGIDGSFNLADVRDLAQGIILAAEKGRKGECYILGNEEVKFRDFTRMIAEESGCKPVRMFLPIWASYVMADVLEKQAKKKGTKPLMTRFSVYNLDRNNTFDCSKAQQELGYTTRPYQETIRDEVDWLMDTGKIKDNRHHGHSAPAKTAVQAGRENVPMLCVSVSDTGCGMDEDTINHIFEKYYQNDTKSLAKGNGIGLSIVERVVDLHHGRIEVTSTPGEGSTFRVHLPEH